MDKATEGQLIAWEALAREAFKMLTPEQREAAKRLALPTCLRRSDDTVAAAASKVVRDIR